MAIRNRLPRSMKRFFLGFRSIPTVLAASLVLGGASACIKETPLPESSTPTTGIVGRAFFVAGPKAGEAKLYQVDLATLESKEIESEGWVSLVTGNKDLVVVAAASPRIDKLRKVEGSRLVPLFSDQDPHVSSPALGEKGYVAFIEPEQISQGTTLHLRTVDPGGESISTVWTSNEPIGSATWAGQSLAVIRNPFRDASIVLIKPDGSHAEFASPYSNATRLKWAHGVFAIIDFASGTALVDEEGITSKTFEGWIALSWDPSGKRLLLRKGETLAVASVDDNGEPRIIGRSPVGPIWDAAWIP